MGIKCVRSQKKRRKTLKRILTMSVGVMGLAAMGVFLLPNKAPNEAVTAEAQVPASTSPVPAARQTVQAAKPRAEKPQTPSKPRVREALRPVTPVAPGVTPKETESRPAKPSPNAPTAPITANRPKSNLPEPALAPNMTDEPEPTVIEDSPPTSAPPRSEEAPEPTLAPAPEESATNDPKAVAAIITENSPPSDDEGTAPPSTHTETSETQKRAAVIMLPDTREPKRPAPKPGPVSTTIINKDENTDLIVLPLPSGKNEPSLPNPSEMTMKADKEEIQLASIASVLPAVKSSPPPPKPPAVEFDAGGMWLAQIGAYSDAGTACEIWFDLSETWPNLFMRAERNVSVTDRRGALIYRLRAGAFPDRTNATRFCEIIIADGGDCFVVKRG